MERESRSALESKRSSEKTGELHLLGFVDEEHRPIDRSVHVNEPFFPEQFGAVPPVVRSQGDAKEVAQFAVKIGQVGLRASEPAHGQIAALVQPLGEDTQGGAFARAGISTDQGKAAFAELLFDAPAEAFDLREGEEGAVGNLWREGVKFEAVEGQEFFVHEGFW